MTNQQNNEPTAPKLLRLWPGVASASTIVLLRFVLPVVVPGDVTLIVGLFGALLGTLTVVFWWLFFSRAPWLDRLGAVALMIVGLAATPSVLDESVATGGMGFLYYIYAIPALGLAFVSWAVITHGLSVGLRRATMIATILAACTAWALIQTGGITSDLDSDFSWRWSLTPEERLLARTVIEPTPATRSPAVVNAPTVEPVAPDKEIPAAPPKKELDRRQASFAPMTPGATVEWPGFRGLLRDSHMSGVRIATDWSALPPVELWRHPIGPGWSSFAVQGTILYTQEQRGEEEAVSAYDITTGDPVWRHYDAARFYESNGGPGPRGTPTLSQGRVYTFGATGILNVLDAHTGAVVWSRNAASDTDTPVPFWGFASSPLVIEDVVVVAVEGRLVGYDLATGERRWIGPDGGEGYSSPHLLKINGIPQVVLMSTAGAVSITPDDGTVLWEYPWSGGVRIVQPALIADGEILMSRGGTTGIRRVSVANGPDGWKVTERWTSTGLKPYYGDFIVHEDHAYGFDGSILACIEVENGKRKWKGGRYGQGQLALLPDQDLLLVVSEYGELALVRATPYRFTEIARFQAIGGKTWNHPVLVGAILLVRNSEEMAAFRLSPQGN